LYLSGEKAITAKLIYYELMFESQMTFWIFYFFASLWHKEFFPQAEHFVSRRHYRTPKTQGPKLVVILKHKLALLTLQTLETSG
jgi:hypothetical protein